MRGRGTLATIAVALVAVAGPDALTNAGAAAKPKITAQGDVRCSGTAKYKLQLSGKPDRTGPEAWWHTDVVFKPSTLTCTGTTGNGAVQVRTVKVRGAFKHWGIGIQDTSFVCVPVTGRVGGGSLSLKWNAKGGTLRPTQVSYSSAFYTFGIGLSQTTSLEAPAPVAPFGTSSVTGSYAGNGSSQVYLLDKNSSLVFIKHRNCNWTGAAMNGEALMTIAL